MSKLPCFIALMVSPVAMSSTVERIHHGAATSHEISARAWGDNRHFAARDAVNDATRRCTNAGGKAGTHPIVTPRMLGDGTWQVVAQVACAADQARPAGTLDLKNG